MKRTDIEKAEEYWKSDRPLEAGRIIYDCLPVKKRPFWAAKILRLCSTLIQNIDEIDSVYEIAIDDSRWYESRDAFGAVRQLTIRAKRSKDRNELYEAILQLGENTSKVTYNATGGAAPYDENAGRRIVGILKKIVEIVGDVEYERRVWDLVTDEKYG